MKENSLPFQKMALVCTGERCGRAGGVQLRETLKAKVKAAGLADKIRVSKCGCVDRCDDGPNVLLLPDNVWLSGVEETDLETIFARLT